MTNVCRNRGQMRRKVTYVAVSIPSVTGPYTSVDCTLTLLKSSVRKSAEIQNGVYARQGTEDRRFLD